MLELSSNTVKVLGIFGRLSPELETIFDDIEDRYSQKPKNNEFDIFRHLTLTFQTNAEVTDVRKQLDILRDLKQFLPLKIRIKDIFVKYEEPLPGAEHIAIEFDLSETKPLIDFVKERAGNATVATWYIKVIWFVPKENQQKVINELTRLKEIEFTDFHLCSNKQDEANTLCTTNTF